MTSLRLLCLIAILMMPCTSVRADSYDDVRATWVAGFKMMTNQWVAAQTYLAGVWGGMIDGVGANQTMLVLQTLQARAVRDYTPGENLCRFGTLTRTLAATDTKGDTDRLALNQILLDRETMNNGRHNVSAGADKLGRGSVYAHNFCDPGDNDKNNPFCALDGPAPARSNRDIDFSRLLQNRLTLNADFSDGKLTSDEQDLMAFLTNIQASDVFGSLAPRALKFENTTRSAFTFQDWRTILAARSVGRSSITRQVAQKLSGAPGAGQFLRNSVREMGMSDAEARAYLDVGTNAPSYDAQMEVLTRKLYENPNFYVALVDKPTNVKRTQASLLATRLMQRRDIFESLLAREMLLSQLLESRIRDEEQRVRTRLAATTGG